jgi:hypothetical protein
MLGADDIGAQHAQIGKDEARLGITRAKRPEAIDELGEIRRCRRRGKRAVDVELGDGLALASAFRHAAHEEILERRELPLFDGEARRHGVAAAIQQQARLMRGNHDRAQRQSGH